LKVLPSGMSNLDDFADSDGNVLPLSSFAKSSQKRFEDHQKLLSGKGNAKTKGWFRSFFRNKKGSDMLDMDGEDPNSRQKVELSSQGKALVGIAVACDVERIVQVGTSCHPETTVQLLLDSLDAYPFEKSPKDEQHAVFAIELAARALLSNQTRSAETYLPFLSKFESILCRMAETEKDNFPAPFVIERIVVTILRSCIHLYEFNEVRHRTVWGTSSLTSVCLLASSSSQSIATTADHDSTATFRPGNLRQNGLWSRHYSACELSTLSISRMVFYGRYAGCSGKLRLVTCFRV
jgi:hypothetical protein